MLYVLMLLGNGRGLLFVNREEGRNHRERDKHSFSYLSPIPPTVLLLPPYFSTVLMWQTPLLLPLKKKILYACTYTHLFIPPGRKFTYVSSQRIAAAVAVRCAVLCCVRVEGRGIQREKKGNKRTNPSSLIAHLQHIKRKEGFHTTTKGKTYYYSFFF